MKFSHFIPLSIMGIISIACMWVISLEILHMFSLSPLVISIFLGMIIGNTIRKYFPTQWDSPIIFASKKLLRFGIILYGFRVTFTQVLSLGWESIVFAAFILVSTILVAYVVGKKILNLDTDTTLLVGAGSSICGAAAILATESTLKSSPEKSSLAISTIVVFGTLSMFLYPFIFHAGLLPFSVSQQGVFIGGTIHEVAQVVGAGNLIGEGVAQNAVIVKMTRVMLLVPFLFFLSVWIQSRNKDNPENKKNNIQSILGAVPLFAVLFLVTIGVNSLITLPETIHSAILTFDTFLLTIAMFALGLETNIQKMKNSGGKAFLLAAILFMWLSVAGVFGVWVSM